MKTKTVVEVTNKELIDLVVEAAKRAVKPGPGPGPVKAEFHKLTGSDGESDVTATVTFEWGAKASGG